MSVLRVPRVPPREVLPLLHALATALVVEAGLRTTTLPRLARMLGAPLCLEEPGLEEPGLEDSGLEDRATAPDVVRLELDEHARRRLRTTRRLLRHWPFGDTCLRQALVNGHQLRHLHPRLQVGVAKHDGEVRAHAWLVVGGVVVDPLYAAASYQPLAAVPESGRP